MYLILGKVALITKESLTTDRIIRIIVPGYFEHKNSTRKNRRRFRVGNGPLDQTIRRLIEYFLQKHTVVDLSISNRIHVDRKAHKSYLFDLVTEKNLERSRRRSSQINVSGTAYYIQKHCNKFKA